MLLMLVNASKSNMLVQKLLTSRIVRTFVLPKNWIKSKYDAGHGEYMLGNNRHTHKRILWLQQIAHVNDTVTKKPK